MSRELRKKIKQSADFDGPATEALLGLIKAADFIRTLQNKTFAKFNLTSGQYNVLRILRGIHPEGYARGEISERMLENAPDVTRLLDRLEAAGLVSRERLEHDQRVSVNRITKKGLQLLEEMKGDLKSAKRGYEKLLTDKEFRRLIEICEKIYTSE